MKRSIFVFLTFLTAAIFFGSPAPADDAKIYSIALDDDIINPVTAEYITSSIEKAEAEKAVCIIIQLDTPGGLLSSTRTIVKKIMNSKVPVVVYVAPKGSRAGSAGVFITLSANIAAMAPSTNIGAAHPVELADKRKTSDSFDELMKQLFSKKDKEKRADKTPKEQVEPMGQKILNDTKAWAAAIAKDRGRSEAWAVKAVEESVSVTDDDALKIGIIDLIAANADELIAKIDGRVVDMAGKKITLNTKGAAIVTIPKNFRLKWLSALAHPNIAYILLMLGFYGLLFEFTHPGVVFPGVAGAVCLILAFFGLQVLPTNYAGVALIVLAIGMFIAEIKVTSYGLLTLGGIISILIGSLILFASPYDFMRVSVPIVLAFTLATFAVAMFLTFIVMRSRNRRVSTGLEGLVGEQGEVEIWKGNTGKIFVHGETWNAESGEELLSGDRVDIVSVKGMTLIVKKYINKANC